MGIKTIPLFFCLVVCVSAEAAVTIGTESLVSLPASSEWSQIHNRIPGNGETVTINPPVFQWVYQPTPREVYGASGGLDQIALRAYKFLCSYNSDLSSPVVSVLTSNNFYNYIAPFDNSTDKTVYWSVGYLYATNPLVSPTAWITTNTFIVPTTATNWDRSMLADDSYMAYASAHPHILFNATNRVAMTNYLMQNKWDRWTTLTNVASILSASWWTTTNVSTIGDGNAGEYVAQVAWSYALTQNPAFTNNLANILNAMADRYIANGYCSQDVVDGVSLKMIKGMAGAYDWSYPLLNTAQRSNVLFAFELSCSNLLHESWWATYTGQPLTRRSMAGIMGNSHFQVNAVGGFVAALSGYGENAVLRDFLEYHLNYSLSKVIYYAAKDGAGLNQGRTYASDMFDPKIPWWQANTFAAIAFPSAQMHLSPFWNGVAEWWMWFVPIYHSETHNPWGDGGQTRKTCYLYDSGYRDLACFVNNGQVYRHWKRSYDAYSGSSEDFDESIWSAPVGYYYPAPVEADATTNANVLLNQGWAMSFSLPPNDYGVYTNGVGFITQARPEGGLDYNHTWQSDGSFELWAYGAHLTDAGPGTISQSHPMLGYSLFVDGYSMCTPNRWPIEPWNARITAWTNCNDFTYVSMDLTPSFARSNFWAMGNETSSSLVEVGYRVGPSAHVGLVQRSILFPRKKYWVIYDVMKTSQPSTFAWLYHVLEPTAVVNTQQCSFAYTATNHYGAGENVTVHVSHIVDPAAMGITNMTGTRSGLIQSRLNPFTGVYLTGLSPIVREHAIWVTNVVQSTNWHFMSVIYPQKWTDAAPTITRIDDYSVAVTNGTEYDVISFDTNSATATLIVDVGATNAAPTAQTTQPTLTPGTSARDFATGAVTVALSSETGARIFWTTNGATPTAASSYVAHGGTVAIAWPVTLKAFATNSAKSDSYVSSAIYTQSAAPGTVATPTFAPGAGTYSTAQTVTISCATPASSIFWSTNNLLVGTAYTAPVNVTNTSTLRAYATATGMDQSATATNLYTITPAAPPASTNRSRVTIGRAGTVTIQR